MKQSLKSVRFFQPCPFVHFVKFGWVCGGAAKYVFTMLLLNVPTAGKITNSYTNHAANQPTNQPTNQPANHPTFRTLGALFFGFFYAQPCFACLWKHLRTHVEKVLAYQRNGPVVRHCARRILESRLVQQKLHSQWVDFLFGLMRPTLFILTCHSGEFSFAEIVTMYKHYTGNLLAFGQSS